VQAYGRDLHEARETCRRYRTYGELSELDKVWDIYYGVSYIILYVVIMELISLQVFKKIEKQLPQLNTLDLQYVSPDLLKARNLELAVPGKRPVPSRCD
jgi:serine/threonine-protein kinase mTOR